jgi:hypothetical protein
MTVSITTTPLVDHAAYVQMCECGQGPRVGGKATGCKRCERIDQQRYERDTVVSQVSSVLRRSYPDWIDGTELRGAINHPEVGGALWNLQRAGKVEQRPEPGSGLVYRWRRG